MMDADFSETSAGQGNPSDDLAFDLLSRESYEIPPVWQQFLEDEPERFIDERVDFLVYPDYLMALCTYYATQATERHHVHAAQQRAIVAAFEEAVYDVLIEKLGQ